MAEKGGDRLPAGFCFQLRKETVQGNREPRQGRRKQENQGG